MTPAREQKIAEGVFLVNRCGRVTLDLGDEDGGATLDVDKRALLAFVLSSGAYSADDLKAIAAGALGNVRVETLAGFTRTLLERLDK